MHKTELLNQSTIVHSFSGRRDKISCKWVIKNLWYLKIYWTYSHAYINLLDRNQYATKFLTSDIWQNSKHSDLQLKLIVFLMQEFICPIKNTLQQEKPILLNDSSRILLQCRAFQLVNVKFQFLWSRLYNCENWLFNIKINPSINLCITASEQAAYIINRADELELNHLA